MPVFAIMPQQKSTPVWARPAKVSRVRVSRFGPLGAGSALFRDFSNASECHVSQFMSHEGDFLSRCIDELSGLCRVHAIDGACSGRVKTFASTCQKMHRRGLGYAEILDRIGVRIVVQNIDHCYHLLSRIRALYPGRTHSIRDYVAYPKSNGYQSLHVSIRSHEQRRLEVQIRTLGMDRESKGGDAAHSNYKNVQRM
jgi:(p)ppGpp synthase/HD superfamily hydrolase